MKNISFDWYRIFYYAADYMNFSRAAQALYMTQPNVSQTIKQLEGELGVILFKRHGRHLSLTKEGEVLLNYVKKAMEGLSEGQEIMERYRDFEKGEIIIGASDTLCRHYLLPILKDFHDRYPQLSISIENQPSPRTLEAVKKGQVDLGFINHSDPIMDKTLEQVHWRPLDEVFFTSPAYARREGYPVTLGELSKHAMISLKKNTSTRSMLDDYFATQELTFTPAVEVISLDLIVDLVKIGLGIGFADRQVIKKELDRKELLLLPIKQTMPKRNISLVYNQDLYLSKAARAFMDLLKP